MIIALTIASALVIGTSIIHYEALRLISAWVSPSRIASRARILLIVLACLLAHVLEIGVYAAAYLVINWAGLGTIEGELQGTFSDYVYFSATSYSTLGIGDVYPTGLVRLISGFEAVNGLFLIAWSTSFTYLAMERLWPMHSRRSGDGG